MAASTSDSELDPAGVGSSIDAVVRLVAETIGRGDAGKVSSQHLTGLVSAAVRLYAAACEDCDRELPPVGSDISTTEAVRLAVALSRSQNLSAFDLALWFAQTEPGRER